MTGPKNGVCKVGTEYTTLEDECGTFLMFTYECSQAEILRRVMGVLYD